MSAPAPWSVKGIDPKAREIAKDLARRSGMTLGEWLNTIIMDGPGEDGSLVTTRRSAGSDQSGQDENGVSTALVNALGERLEETERRSASAIEGIHEAVASLMRRMDAATELDTRRERRLDDISRELREGHQRLRKLESQDSEDLKLRLDRAEDATRIALTGLERSFAALDQRFSALEGGPGASSLQLKELAERLGRQIEANRQDMLRRLAGLGDVSRLSRLEQTLDKLVLQTAAAEQKSARAVEAMGQEIMRIARNMNGRMQAVEQASNGATLDQRLAELGRVLDEKLDREIARHAEVVESRLTRQEDQHALALERLGGEITRISDRLSERISQTERRSTQAIEDIGRRLAESSEKLERRSEDVSGEIAERIRQSEERTRRLLEEAREVRARREAAAHNPAARLTSAEPPATTFDDVPDFISSPQSSVSLFGAAPTDDWLPQQAGADDWRAAALSDDLSDDVAKDTVTGTPGWDDDVAADLAVEPFAAPADLRPFATADEDADEAQDPIAVTEETDEEADAAFASIFAEAAEEAPEKAPESDPVETGIDAIFGGPLGEDALSFTDPLESDAQPASEALEASAQDDETAQPENDFFATVAAELEEFRAPLTTRDAIDHARAAIAEEEPEPAPRKTFGLGKLRRKGGTSALQQKLDRKAAHDGWTFGQALKVSALAMLVVGGGGYGTLKLLKDQDAPLDLGQAPARPVPATPMASLALDVTPTDAVPSQAVASTEGAAIFARAANLLDAGDPSGLEPLKRAAELGYVPAQMRLAALYTDGGPGVEADPVEAREWVRRAAEAGDPKAMQHYATQLYDGTGGERDPRLALYWMRKSAEAGRVDSQYNVAHLYEKGVPGVPADRVEAFTWYMIAARNSDQQALQDVQRLTPQLTDDQRKAARAAADNFTVQPVS